MNRGFKLGFFALVVVLSAYFVLAASGSLAPSTTSASATISTLWFNVSNTSATGNNLTSISVLLTGNASFANVTSVNISGGGSSYSNGSITGSTVTINVANAQITGNTNFTLNITLSSSATYGFSVGTNVTAITNQTNVSYSALPYSSGTAIILESTDPTVSAPERASQTRTSITTDFTSAKCSDSGDAASGISTCVLSSSDGTVDGAKITGLSCGKSYDITITATDKAGNTAFKTESLSTQACGGGGIIVPKLPSKSHVWNLITPGAATIMKDFDAEIGVKQIEITVSNEAQNVKITVTKYDGKPAEVSVSKTGKVYQYLQIDAPNLAGKLANAAVQFRVEKSWASSNGVSKEKVAIYKFDETSSKWNEQTTTSSGEDGTYYYYDVSLDSLSYFAISERSLAAGEGTTATGETVEEGRSLAWLWILIVVVVVLVVWRAVRKK